MPSALTRLLLIFLPTCLSACGGRSPADLQRTIGYTQQQTAQGQIILDLASQNRLSMQQNAPFSYRYISPQADENTTTRSEIQPPPVETPQARPSDSPLKEKPSSGSLTPKSEQTLTPLPSPSPPPQVKNFTLENLQGHQTSFQFPREKVLVLAIADQKGSEDMENWIQPLYDRYGTRVDIEGVAELSAVPAFARGIARGIISGLVKQPILLDWKGEVSQQFNAKKNVTNLYIIHPQGHIITSNSGEATLEKLKEMVKAIDSAL